MPSWAISRVRWSILTRRLPPVGYANEFDPDYAIAHANRGLLRYQQLSDIPGALADLNLAILLDPRDASTYTTRGLIKYGELGDIEYALADYDLAIEIDPTFAPAYNCRGLLKNVKLMDIAGALGDYDYLRYATRTGDRARSLLIRGFL